MSWIAVASPILLAYFEKKDRVPLNSWMKRSECSYKIMSNQSCISVMDRAGSDLNDAILRVNIVLDNIKKSLKKEKCALSSSFFKFHFGDKQKCADFAKKYDLAVNACVGSSSSNAIEQRPVVALEKKIAADAQDNTCTIATDCFRRRDSRS
jgi:hypothetical protein